MPKAPIIYYNSQGLFKHFLMSILLMQCFIFKATAQEVKISAQVDSANILIGDQINLKLSATYNPQEVRVQFPLVQDTFNHFEVVERGKMDTLIGRNENTFSQIIKLTNFDSGQWVIPAYNFEIQSLKGATPNTFTSDSIVVSVNTIAVDTAKPFKPIMAIRGAKMPWQLLAMYIAGAIVLLAVLAFLIWYLVKTLRERNNKPVITAPEIILLPHEKALRELDRIEMAALWKQSQEKAYHTELTDAIRKYLEEQFGLDCFEKTSTEIVQQVKKIKALATSRQTLRTIFETADMVKFAKSKPTEEQHENCLILAKEFILESYKRVRPIEPQSTQA